MSASIFGDKTTIPTDRTLSEALGDSNRLWRQIKKHLKTEYDELTEEWKFYGQKNGWLLKTLWKKRNLFFLVPLEESFRLSFTFGDKAVAAVEKSKLPKDLISTLKKARKYAEGRVLQIEVKSSDDVENIQTLVRIKVNN